MKAVVAAFNQEKALVGAFSVITNLRMELSEALLLTELQDIAGGGLEEEEPCLISLLMWRNLTKHHDCHSPPTLFVTQLQVTIHSPALCAKA